MNGGRAIGSRPLYDRHVGDPAQPWRDRSDWAVAQRVDHPDPAEANRLALLDLEGGADALALVFSGSPCARGDGIAEPADMRRVLEGVELDLIALRLDAGHDVLPAATALAGLVSERRLGSAALAADLGFDPVALEAFTGRAPEPGLAAALVRTAAEAGLGGCPLLVDARPWHEAGAREPRELALVLATAAAHLRMLDAAGLSLDEAWRAMAVLLPFDADVPLGLAKARAMRRLWARLQTACGLTPLPLRLHAETSWRAMCRYDPWTNVMRATAGVFAAGLGGADTVSALPFTQVIGLPDAAARRLARNVGRVLLDEAHLGKVDDPAAGSGAWEEWTDELCRTAWSLFQDIERAGGVLAELRGGTVGRALAIEATERRVEVAGLTRGIVGTSLYPELDVPPPAVLDVARRPEPTRGERTIVRERDAEPFERLRDRVEARTAATGRPCVALAALGEPAASGAHVARATKLLATVGAGVHLLHPASGDPTSLVDAFRESASDVACLCGDDAALAAEGAALARALAAAGAGTVLVLDGAVADAETLPSCGKTLPASLERIVDRLCPGERTG